MNCSHRPASFAKMLTQGDEGMTCRYCQRPIRTKDSRKANIIRKILVILPIVLFCVITLTDLSALLPGKVALLAFFFCCLGVSIVGWLIVCRFFLEYEEVPDPENADTDETNI